MRRFLSTGPLPALCMKLQVTVAMFMLAIPQAFGQWVQTGGPVGGQTRDIVEVQGYLVVNGYDGGIFRSGDNGQTWEAKNNGLPGYMRCHALDVYSDTLYIATIHGLYFSPDLGDTWELISPDVKAYSLEVSGQEIFAGAASNHGMYYSPDGGTTWVMRYPGGPSETVWHILKTGERLWIGMDAHFLCSTDAGETWFNPGLSIQPSGLTLADGELFVSGNQSGYFRVYRSSDQGLTWTRILDTEELNVGASGLVKTGDEIFVAGTTTLYHSPDDGGTWDSNPLLPGFTFFAESFMTNVDDDIYVSYTDGILYTHDKGATWERRNSGLKNHSVDRLEKTSDAVISFSEHNGVSVTLDEGQHWNAIHDRSRFIPRYVYGYENTLILCYDLEVYRSVDNGTTWEKILTLVDDIQGGHFVPVPHLGGNRESLVLSTYWGVYLSKDLGTNWSFVPRSVFNPEEPEEGFVSGDRIVISTESSFYFSTDFGGEWTRKDKPRDPVLGTPRIKEMIIESTFLTLITSREVLKSRDFGSTWKRMSYIPPSIIFDAESAGDTLLLVANSDIYVNNGERWYVTIDAVPNARTLSILLKDGFVYAGTWGKSVWKRQLGDLLKDAKPLASLPRPQLQVDCNGITITNPVPGVDIQWYRNGELIPGEASTSLHVTGEGSYLAAFENEVDVTTSHEASFTQQPQPEIELYNIVTVNGDEKNENFVLDADLLGSTLQVFDRWGDTVYYSASYQNDWTPSEITPGIYFYSVENECYGIFKSPLTVTHN